jgi:hypothetical protein
MLQPTALIVGIYNADLPAAAACPSAVTTSPAARLARVAGTRGWLAGPRAGRIGREAGAPAAGMLRKLDRGPWTRPGTYRPASGRLCSTGRKWPAKPRLTSKFCGGQR